MAYLIALGILSLVGVVGTVWLVRTDGYARIPTDPSRVAPESRATTRSRSSLPAAAPAVEAARPTVYVTPASVSPTTTPLRIVAAD
ncbi:hypothetical protein [Microbacterium sp. lyk4-40-TSB-66]|uniref:hypothetical protein n=1 Tax=Microbacterium sp. lyk4-40-TSB-66 TaxID=3040294 RepID=UPI00254CC48D|nr:hypothetical protein [Microbacterium sp. lyk4-40-TSB-66]